MTPALFLLQALRLLGPCPAPMRCPYCPAHTRPHWIGWGCYERYAGDPEHPSRKVVVPRYWCKIQCRTFSLLPHALLPYCSIRAGLVLEWLHALLVEGQPLDRLAGGAGVARGTLRGLQTRFRRARPHLRLPKRPGALSGAGLLVGLGQLRPEAIVALFQGWKEREPKHSVVGLHSRSPLGAIPS